MIDLEGNSHELIMDIWDTCKTEENGGIIQKLLCLLINYFQSKNYGSY